MTGAAGAGMLASVKPPAWYLNAALRTAKAFLPGLARPDDAFAASWLPRVEYDLYRLMDARDRDHACRVAHALLALAPDADPTLVRAALLHDVGKADTPYRAWERIVVHVYTPASDGSLRAPTRAVSEALRRHREHAARGASMILAVGGDARVAALVRHHHDADGPEGVALLRRVDART